MKHLFRPQVKNQLMLRVHLKVALQSSRGEEKQRKQVNYAKQWSRSGTTATLQLKFLRKTTNIMLRNVEF